MKFKKIYYETVFEMHFHNAIMNQIKSTLGLGKGKFNFYKYSPQKECFVGFDLAYVRTDLKEDKLFEQLKNDAVEKGYNLTNFFVGLFLQYKVVSPMQKKNRTTPEGITQKPYFRVFIDTKKNNKTGSSQHKLLYNLSKNIGSFVFYACPMIFEYEELYEQPADLKKLRLVDLVSCPSEYCDNDSHYIFFNEPTSNPIWCSDPQNGTAYSPEYLSKMIRDRIQDSTNMQKNQIKLLDLLLNPPKMGSESVYQTVAHRMKRHPDMAYPMKRYLDLLYNSLIILHYKSQEVDN